jgi:putative ABC transport system ATP-binding protein
MGLDLDAHGVRLRYPVGGGGDVPILAIDRLRVGPGETVGIGGPSGSGKTSLLYVLTGVQRPQQGRVAWDGRDIAALPEGACDRWRRRSVGFIFQDFHLFAGLTALENVLLPSTFCHVMAPASLRRRARELLSSVGLVDRARPIETFSRGEQQRVALARALLFAPPLVVTDEPTASLDTESSRIVIGLLLQLCRDAGSTLIAVSHDVFLLGRLDSVYTLVAGRLEPRRPAIALS